MLSYIFPECYSDPASPDGPVWLVFILCNSDKLCSNCWMFHLCSVLCPDRYIKGISYLMIGLCLLC